MMSSAELRIPGTRETRALLHSFGSFWNEWLFQRLRGILLAWHRCLSQGWRWQVTCHPAWLMKGHPSVPDEKSFPASFFIVLSQKVGVRWELLHPASHWPWVLLISDPALSTRLGKVSWSLLWPEFPHLMAWLPGKMVLGMGRKGDNQCRGLRFPRAGTWREPGKPNQLPPGISESSGKLSSWMRRQPWNQEGWTGPLRSSSPTAASVLPHPPINHFWSRNLLTLPRTVIPPLPWAVDPVLERPFRG